MWNFEPYAERFLDVDATMQGWYDEFSFMGINEKCACVSLKVTKSSLSMSAGIHWGWATVTVGTLGLAGELQAVRAGIKGFPDIIRLIPQPVN